MRICVAGTRGKTSLIHRLIYDTFSLVHKPTLFVEIHRVGGCEFVEIPDTEHGMPMECDLLLLTCGTQSEVQHLAKDWFGLYKHLMIILVNAPREKAYLCPDENLKCVSNLSREGISELRYCILERINRIGNL